jgi:hypothetical protein
MRLDKFQWQEGDLEIVPPPEHGHSHKAAGVRFIPKGEAPSAVLPDAEISEAEVDAALRVFDAEMPAEFRGLLEAEEVQE